MMVGAGRSLLVQRASSAPAYDALALDWAARVVANGGAEPSTATKQAVSDFCAALRSANILSKMLAVCCLTPGGLVEALTPLIKTSGGAAYGTELVTNGAFTSDTSGWTSANGAALSLISGVSGNGLQVQGDYVNPNPQARQTITTVPGVRYKLNFWHKQPGAGVGKVLVGTTAGGGDLYTSPDLTGASWQSVVVYFTATSNTTYLSVGAPNAGTNYYFDSVSCQVAVLCNDPWTNYNFVSGDLTVNGLQGDGATKYARTGFTPSLHFSSVNSAGLTLYYMTHNIANGYDFGIKAQFDLFLYSGTMYFDCWQITTGRISAADGTFDGYRSGNRVASDDQKIYKANSTTPHTTLASGTGAPGAISTFEMYLLFATNGGSYSNQKVSFAAIHEGLTSGESASFYSAVQALRQALGGGYA